MAGAVVAPPEMELVQHIQTALVAEEQQALVAQQLPQPHSAQFHQQPAVRSKVALAQDTRQLIMKVAVAVAAVYLAVAAAIAMERSLTAAAEEAPSWRS